MWQSGGLGAAHSALGKGDVSCALCKNASNLDKPNGENSILLIFFPAELKSCFLGWEKISPVRLTMCGLA